MSIITANTVHIDNFPMQIAKITMTKAGDSITQDFTYRGVTKEEFVSRHVLASGWLSIDGYLNGQKVGTELNESPYISRLRHGIIITPSGSFDIDSCVSTALEDNTTFYCVHPVTQRDLINNAVNDVVRDKVWRIPANAAFHFTVGRYYFSNVDLEINGQIRKALEPIACVYREVDVVPPTDAAIAEFWVEKVFISKQ